MKKIVSLVLALILSLAMVCSAESLAGGWNLPEDNAMTPEAQTAFDKATSELVGCAYEPIVVLGTQVVAGINYVILAKVTPIYPGAEANYALVYIYADLSGNAGAHLDDGPARQGIRNGMHMLGKGFRAGAELVRRHR